MTQTPELDALCHFHLGTEPDDQWYLSNRIYNLKGECMLRKSFGKMAAQFTSTENNYGSHPKTAGERSAARAALGTWCDQNNLVPNVIDMSMSDQHLRKKGKIFGRHELHVPKDAAHAVVKDPLDCGDAYLFVDSDYYHDDIEKYIIRKPCVMYTCMPDRVARQGVEYTYMFNSSDELIYTSSSGHSYQHKIWNWRTDGIDVKSMCGVYHIKTEFIQVSPDRYMVITIPTSWTRTIFGSPFSISNDKYHKLARYKVSKGGHNAMTLVEENDGQYTHMISVAAVGNPIAAVLPLSSYNAARVNYAQAGSAGLNNIDTIIGRCFKDDPFILEHKVSVRQAIICQIDHPESYRVGLHGKSAMTTFFEPDDLPVFPETKKAKAVFLGNPLVTGATVPAATTAAAKIAIQKRIVEVRSSPTQDSVINKYKPLVKDFLAVFKQTTPLTTNEVNLRQDKPTQRAAYARVGQTVFQKDEPSSGFIKSESMANANKDPRIISQVSKQNKILWSKYTLAAADQIKTQRWYAFGKTPAKIAQRVHKLASIQTTKFLVMTDYSRFDGTRSTGIAEFEQMFMLHLFGEEHHDEIVDLFTSELDIYGYLLDERYEVRTARLSGSPDTSLLNSYTNALVAYLTYREMGYDHDKAYGSLGLYGGDDGMTPNADKTMYIQVAKDLGLNLKVEALLLPSEPLTFLARTYYQPDVSDGSTTDVLRALSKIHISVGGGLTSEERFARKYVGLSVTDADTPIIRDVLTSFQLATTPDAIEKAGKDPRSYSYVQTQCRDRGYPSFKGDHIIMAYLEKVSGVSGTLWEDFANEIKVVPFSQHELSPIIDEDVLFKRRCVTNGQFKEGEPNATSSSAQSTKTINESEQHAKCKKNPRKTRPSAQTQPPPPPGPRPAASAAAAST